VTKPLPLEHVSLVNGHATLKCFDCHVGPAAFAKPKACVDCHGPNHGGLTACGDCHDPRLNWKPKANFDHAAFFPLVGQHATLECAQCHPTGNFAAANPACVSCHGVRHGGLTACASCHTPAGFKPSTFKHSSVFALTGRHAKLACTSCHPKSAYAKAIGSPTSCSSCHGVKHGGLTACGSCHTTAGFVPSTFKHSSVWPLVGKHGALACSQCHPQRDFANPIGDKDSCTSCHGTEHGGLTACGSCHTPAGFKPSTFKHSSVWPLVGQHGTLACTACHPGGVFGEQIGSKDSCTSCHGVAHGGLTACGSCHTPAGFVPSTFRHETRWPLTGKHALLACTSCHPSNQYAQHADKSACTNCHGVFHGNQTRCEDCHTTAGFNLPKTITHPAPIVLGASHASMSCRVCHLSLEFNAPTKPCLDCHTAPHVAPTDCVRCHQPSVWTDVTKFRHDAIGSHTGIPYEDACVYCHTTGNYAVYTCSRCHFAF